MVGVYVMLLGGGSNCQGCGCKPDDCLSYSTPTNLFAYFDGDIWLAASIVVGDSAITINSVTIYADDFNAPLNPDGTLENNEDAPFCLIYSSNTPDPEYPGGSTLLALIATLTPPSLFSPKPWTFTHSGLSLSANTIYWVVMGAGGYSPYWTARFYDFPSGSKCLALGAISTNSGATWSYFGNGSTFKFEFS
jgi:hypothetical protein